MGLKRRNPTKNPPLWTHEFMIQNHGDIVSCVALVFVVGLMFQFSSPYASIFIVIQHNITSTLPEAGEVLDQVLYTTGLKDLCTIFFYFLICIVLHAVVQEYILDKINRKLHLSKAKHSKLNESGQLIVFYIASLIWGVNVYMKDGISLQRVWEKYPENMPFGVKFWWLIQLAYWLHAYPELYFQRVKREDWPPRFLYITLYLVFLSVAYIFNFNRIALVFACLHYFAEIIFHGSRLMYFSDNNKIADYGFMVWNVCFIGVRLLTMALAITVFFYGLAKNENQGFDLETANFNTQIVRINCMVAILLLQTWMTWNFITFHMRRSKERKAVEEKQPVKRKEKKTKKHKDTSKRGSEEDVSELPEVDQNTKKSLRWRK